MLFSDLSGESRDAPVAQMDRVSVSEAEGRGFESRRARQRNQGSIEVDLDLASTA